MIADKYPEDKERSKAMGIAMGGSAAGVLGTYEDLLILQPCFKSHTEPLFL